MKVEKLIILYNTGDLDVVGTITEQKEIRKLFRNEIICAQTDFEYAQKQYLIEEVYLPVNENGLLNLFVAVSDYE